MTSLFMGFSDESVRAANHGEIRSEQACLFTTLASFYNFIDPVHDMAYVKSIAILLAFPTHDTRRNLS
jgi:hypothetical protein